jgi:hypothetical protein
LAQADVCFGDSRFRRRIAPLRLDAPVRRQSQTIRKHLHGSGETVVEGGRTIPARGKTFVEGRGRVIQSGETLFERRIPARRRGRIRQHARRLGWGVEQSDLRFQACQSYAIACGA